MAAGNDETKWIESGAEAFATALFEIIHRLIDEGYPEIGAEKDPPVAPDPLDSPEIAQSLIAQAFARMTLIRNTPVYKIAPRRVAAGERLLRTERPTAESGPAVVSFSDNSADDGGAEPVAKHRSQGQ
jgi:hypothetical protein